jgi:hypothetical protein
MGQGDPGRQHQAAGMKSRPKIGKTFHNVSFRECVPDDRCGSCVTSADVSIGGAQLYER